MGYGGMEVWGVGGGGMGVWECGVWRYGGVGHRSLNFI